MAYFAQIDENNVVIRVLAVSNNDAPDPAPNDKAGNECLNSIGLAGTWIQTSYNGRIRKNYAGIGYKYDAERDAFIPPKPCDSWILDENTCHWNAPIPYPSDGGLYGWNEKTLSWDLLDE